MKSIEFVCSKTLFQSVSIRILFFYLFAQIGVIFGEIIYYMAFNNGRFWTLPGANLLLELFNPFTTFSSISSALYAHTIVHGVLIIEGLFIYGALIKLRYWKILNLAALISFAALSFAVRFTWMVH
jgi:hypothetical protein